jgi:PAS domain-containing protein
VRAAGRSDSGIPRAGSRGKGGHGEQERAAAGAGPRDRAAAARPPRPDPAGAPGRLEHLERDLDPLVFLAGLSFETFFAQHPEQRHVQQLLNVVTVVSVLTFALLRVRRWRLDRHDPLLVVGMLVLLGGAGGNLLDVFSDESLLELMLKTIGTVMMLFALDRMERRAVVMALESSEEYLESFFESIPDPLVVIGEGRKVLAANRVAIHAFGEQILQGTCCEGYLGHDQSKGQCKDDCTVSQAWTKRKPRFELVRDDKGARRYEVTTFPLFGRAASPASSCSRSATSRRTRSRRIARACSATW